MNKFLKVTPLIALSFCLCFGLAGCKLGGSFEDTSVTYSLNDDGESYSLTHVGRDIKDMIIPETYNDLPVTCIASRAFICSTLLGGTKNVKLNTLVLPKSIKTIERGAFEDDRGSPWSCCYSGTLDDWLNISFGCSPLNGALFLDDGPLGNLRIPNGMTEIPAYAFDHCQSLKSVEIPEGVESIGEYAFSACALTQVILPQSLKAVGSCAFYYNNITNLEIPAALSSWGERAFARCRIVNLTLPEGLTSVGDCAFENNVLTELTIPSTLADWGSSAFRECHIEKLNLTDGLQSIGKFAFNIYSSGHDEVIEELTIPQSVKIIKERAFHGKKIAKLNLPSEVIIEDDAFYGCGLTDEDINKI